MPVISIGFDPAPPGKLPLEKALCDSDFDGCVCAAILKTVYPQLSLFFADPGSVQAGDYNHMVNDKTLVSDLPYVKGCGIYFDHHAGNRPETAMPGRWENTPCAAAILYKYFNGFPGIAHFAGIVCELGRFDGGSVTLKDVREPNIFFELGFAIDRRDHDFQRHFAELLARVPWDEVLKDEKIQAKLADARKEREVYLEFLKTHTVIRSNVAFVDLKDYSGKNGHSYCVGMLYPDIDGIVVIKHDNGEHKFTLFRNAFKEHPCKEVDFLRIAKAINPQLSGGHKSSCGFTLPKEWSVDQGIAEVEKAVQVQEDGGSV